MEPAIEGDGCVVKDGMGELGLYSVKRSIASRYVSDWAGSALFMSE